MGMEIFKNEFGEAVFVNTSILPCRPFGCVINEEDVEDFLRWLKIDPRKLDDAEFIRRYEEYKEFITG